tara:strand:- start:229 stop:564 length:336 start_codon:yes stop_codon:yes gene_type:complete
MKKLSSKLFIFFLIFGSFFTPTYSEEWNKERDAKITSKIDVETFWKQVKKTREIKYGKDLAFSFCNGNFVRPIAAIIKIDIPSYIMSNLIRYTSKCLETLGLMTKYVLQEE